METTTKIFLVDDDVFSLSVYQQCLENLGYTNVSMFFNGMICLENLHQKPSIVFLDYNMDDYSGLQVLEKIRLYDPEIYVVIVSGREDLKLALQILRLGAFDYIIKGDDQMEKMEEVIDRIQSLRHVKDKNRGSIFKKLRFDF